MDKFVHSYAMQTRNKNDERFNWINCSKIQPVHSPLGSPHLAYITSSQPSPIFALTIYHSHNRLLQSSNSSASQIISSVVFLVPFGLPSRILDLDRTYGHWELVFVCFSFFFL